MRLRRRQVLGLVGGATALAAPALTLAQVGNPHPRIGVSSNSFREMFAAGELDMLRYPGFVRTRLNLSNLELISTGFRIVDGSYCRQVRRAAGDEGCRIINLLHTDPKVDLVAGSDADRQRAQDEIKRWMDRAAQLGSPSFRTNANFTPPGQPGELERVVAAYKPLASYGQNIGVKLLVENHVGFTSSIDNTIAVVRGVNSPNLRAIVDWGNSPAKDDPGRVADCQRLMPYVDLISAKGVNFDDSNRHVSFDHAALVKAAEAGGYRSLYSIDLYATPAPKDPIGACRGMIHTIQENLVA